MLKWISAYHDDQTRGPFVGCPGDADREARMLVEHFRTLPRSGARQSFFYWARDYDGLLHRDGGYPDQHRIQKTSDHVVNPVFILFRDTIGSPVPKPPEGWGTLRHYLDDHGFHFIALLGEDFHDVDHVPEGKVPLSGTLFELFSQLSYASEQAAAGFKDETLLRIFVLNYDVPSNRDEQQHEWLTRILGVLQLHRTGSISTVNTIEELRQEATGILRIHLGLGRFDPCVDPLPGLDARRYGESLPARENTIAELNGRLTVDREAFIVILSLIHI